MAKLQWKPGTMIYPVPAVLVSCGTPSTGFNIITIAWTGTICTSPALCYISVRPERYSHDLIKKTGEYVINLTTRKLAFATDWCGVKSGRDVDKFKECNLQPADSQAVASPIIRTPGLHFECKIVFRAAMDPENLIKEYHDLYPAKDYHTLYFGEILACYETD